MQKSYGLQNRGFFYTMLAVLGVLGLWLASNYLGIIVFSLVMVIILKPVYTYFERLLRGRAGLATAATLMALVLAIIIPGWLVMNKVEPMGFRVPEK